MKTVKISLIIPAYNEEKYIWDCLKYALENGKWYIDEIIVVNNNSTDKTKEIAES
jgi:glycosyltransferase involved in cell wall biosynthesis